MLRLSYKGITLLFGLCTVMAVQAQVSVKATIDSTQIRIGSQAHITLNVSASDKATITLPTFKNKELIKEIEVIETRLIDSTSTQGRITLAQQYTITSFTDSLYSLPALEVRVDGQVYRTEPLGLKVIDDFVPIDSTNPDRSYGPTAIVYPPHDWSEWWPLLFPAFGILLSVLTAIILLLRQRQYRSRVRFVQVEAPKPPHEIALNELHILKATPAGNDEEAIKDYYTKMTDALRTYMASRFRFNAMEMTTNEIIEHLRTIEDVEGFNELRNVLETADLVKFAKYHAMLGESNHYLVSAVNFINETKVELSDSPKKIVQRVPIEERERRHSIIKLRLGAILALIVAVICILYLAVQLSHLMV